MKGREKNMLRKYSLAAFAIAAFFCFFFSGGPDAYAQKKPLVVKVYHLPHCKACQKAIHDVIPSLVAEYGEKVRWDYIDISDEMNYSRYLVLEKRVGKELSTPTIVVGDKVLIGLTQVADELKTDIDEALASTVPPAALEPQAVDLLERFRSFGPWAIIGAGLVDGVNPCAFTVIVFFVSFLTFMGYKRRELVLISVAYIFAVFLTYLALGLGFFRILYIFKGFYLVSKIIYLAIGGVSLFLGCVALNDYFLYKRTGRTEGLALQLPKPIKDKIHDIVGRYYRKDKTVPNKALFGLFVSAFVVGFLVSLLEAVCTGQLYLPTIVFVLKEGSLRAKAIFYLIIYNIMFVVPLIVVFLFSLTGVTSKEFEAFGRKHLGFIKIVMAAVFFALGIVLWLGV